MKKSIVKIAICDDDPAFAGLLKKLVDNYLRPRSIGYQSYFFVNGSQLLFRISENFDLIFLDIEMQGIDGMKTAENIRKQNKECTIVFVSSYAAYACQGYKYQATRYLLKDRLDNELEECLDAVLGGVGNEPANDVIIEFHADNELVLLKACDILYFESNIRIVKVFVAQKPYSFKYYEKLDTLTEKLRDKEFFRCHQSFLVNASYIARLVGQDLLLSNGKHIPISRSRYQDVRRQLAFYWWK